MQKLLALGISCVLASPLFAAPVVDGTRDGLYGGPVAVQSVDTMFGDSTGGVNGGGGELDAAYAHVEGGRLYLMITGNVENNFNKLHLFFDTKAGGENILSSTPQYDFNNVSQNFGGLTFDSEFEADYHLFGRWGAFSGNVFAVDIADRAGGVSATVGANGAEASSGGGTAVQSGTINPGDNGLDSSGFRTLPGFISSPIEFGFNNNNSGGVEDGTGSANVPAVLGVTTGLELSISLADLESAGDTIWIHAAYGNGDNNFHSNQFLAGVPAGTNFLGGDGEGGFTGSLFGIDFNDFAGNQYFAVTVPEPTSLAVIGGALAVLIRRRRA